ncbi:hypothetical protein KM800_12080 [Clostridium tyrobutyricum]|uniref:hypothetical protein n=1 Tax=Clostridium tyrobutyricum TaxID=1519 RepID=UPI001C387AF3|nr:hypothetical protein [Clostridium tyrobutyricum]MBV4420052.1 hypothetical protein [Clostridium tyrobutyricum]
MNFPNNTISYSTTKLEEIQNKIEKIKLEYSKLNRNCEIEVISKPNPYMITFDGYTNMKFQLSIYIRHLGVK